MGKPTMPFDITITDGCVQYDNACVLQGVNLTLKAGEWVCLLGKSGVGKSSLLSLLLNHAPSVGCSDNAPLKNRMAWMAQHDSLLPWKSVFDNVALGSILRRQTIDHHHIDNRLSQVGLQGYATALPQTLSGGQRQRVALARTLSENTPVVIMDEPFSALDAITRYKLQNMAHDLLLHKTVLMVTHDPIEAVRLADRILILQTGGDITEIKIPKKRTRKGQPCIRDIQDKNCAPIHDHILQALTTDTQQQNNSQGGVS